MVCPGFGSYWPAGSINRLTSLPGPPTALSGAPRGSSSRNHCWPAIPCLQRAWVLWSLSFSANALVFDRLPKRAGITRVDVGQPSGEEQGILRGIAARNILAPFDLPLGRGARVFLEPATSVFWPIEII